MQMFLLVFQFNKRQKKIYIKICSGKHIISKQKSLESPLMKCERIYRISERTYKKVFGKKQVDLSVGRDKHFVRNYCPMAF